MCSDIKLQHNTYIWKCFAHHLRFRLVPFQCWNSLDYLKWMSNEKHFEISKIAGCLEKQERINLPTQPKMYAFKMINGLYLYTAFLVNLTTQSALTLHVTFAHTLIQHTAHYTVLFFVLIIHTHSYTTGRIGWQHVVQCLVQGHFDMWAGEAWSRTTDLPTGRRLLFLLRKPQLQPPKWLQVNNVHGLV